MPKKLLIVESPTKAKTIAKFLPAKEFSVTSSFGHIRDLPKSKMGIDIEHGFEPEYVIPKDKEKTIETLKTKLRTADTVLLATDHDREGEAIAWHLLHALGLNEKDSKKEVKRIVFHEVTKEAIQHAVENPLELDTNLVDAQQARRVLDRLVGYELSPFLWKAVARGLSAGRVQSAAVRLIVEREKEIRAFDKEEYWSVDGIFSVDGSCDKVEVKLIKSARGDNNTDNDKVEKIEPSKDGQFVARLYSHKGKSLKKFSINTEEKANQVSKILTEGSYSINEISHKEVKRSPKAPFTTSTLQQASNQRFGYSAKQTMFIAQKLYEGLDIGEHGTQGLITYMRTDSVTLSEKFINEARGLIGSDYGKEYLPNKEVHYKTKSKGAQEAHEAIRPTRVELTPDKLKPYLNEKQLKIYSLIWQRAVASQMRPARINSLTVDIGGDNEYVFRATGQTIVFDGFMKVYPSDTKEMILPQMEKGQSVAMHALQPQQHFTQPPARYSEATLVKQLEELGIGRPSTYAPIISTIQERNYVEKTGRNLKPTEIGEVVNTVLEKYFPKILDYEFTANMENELDDIASGKLEWEEVMKRFYGPFKSHLDETKSKVSKKDLEEKTDTKCDKCGQDMVIKIGRFGKFMACSGYPECKNTKPVDNADGEDGANDDEQPEDLGNCPECEKPLVRRVGRFGPFVSCSGYPDCKYIKKDKPKSTDVKCPKCKEGEIMEKRTRRGKVFYGCSGYPKCDQAYWNKPTGENCPQCKGLLTATPKGQVKCPDKECGYKE